MDPTLITILLLLVFATVIALVQSRKRDKCLTDFEGYHISLAEKGGDLTWGRVAVFTSGMEIAYVEPVVAREGHLERSFIFYKDQFEAMDALYRYPEGLTPEEQEQRRAVIEQTANPGFWRRFVRRMRNWISMVRDALLQAVSMVIGAVKTRSPGSAVLSTQEAQLKSLSSEIIGHAGNAFDPLLEHHLFTQVVVEITRGERRYSYCGWLKDYTSQFIEVVDAFANAANVAPLPLDGYRTDDDRCPQVHLRVEAGRLLVTNASDLMLYVQHVEAGPWRRTLGCVLPPTYTADLTLPPDARRDALRAWIGSVERVDMVVPRTHALVRHAANGSETLVPTQRPGTVAAAKGMAATGTASGDGQAVPAQTPSR